MPSLEGLRRVAVEDSIWPKPQGNETVVVLARAFFHVIKDCIQLPASGRVVAGDAALNHMGQSTESGKKWHQAQRSVFVGDESRRAQLLKVNNQPFNALGEPPQLPRIEPGFKWAMYADGASGLVEAFLPFIRLKL